MKTDTRQKAEEIWLHYFNQVLLEKGLISEAEWRKLNWEIRKSTNTQ